MNKHNQALAGIRAIALEHFAAKGFAGTGIRDIARGAGLTPGALYHYIGSKEDLLATIMFDGGTRLLEEGTAALARTSDSPAERLAALIEVHVRIHCELHVEAQVVDTEIRSLTGDNRREVLALRDRYEDLWRGVIVTGMEQGIFKIGHPGVCRLALIQMCTGVANWYDPNGSLGVDELIREFQMLGAQTVGLLPSTKAGQRLASNQPPVGTTSVES